MNNSFRPAKFRRRPRGGKGVRFSEIGNESPTSQLRGNRIKGNAGENLHSGHFRLLLLPKKLPTGVPEIYFPVINYLKLRWLQKLERVKGIEPSFLGSLVTANLRGFRSSGERAH